ncbi:TadE/TadG family type IV pilus assembly protein [Mesorhizobium sp. BAC0120]|uniref:TadE/TadG family type IV pilus assembly protein n=1 Tax=Mesorhizobium sp. BAC0120 TaxID=3090670 RepID=UPI00298C8CFD|nr:TadE/TadG family type IV pilus assembly protein [Mesorhizobium sp. BAC0120]MDW6026034.1 TadE/TadG family type IV pilus assembly protein [Mesorhizobium sp. BAC0120]
MAAIEFAFVAPLLLCMYFASMEASQAIETDKKVSRIASMVADLVTQQQDTTSPVALKAIMDIGKALVQPYNRSRPEIVITAISISDENTPKVTVAWSSRLAGDGTKCLGEANETKGKTTTVPADLNTRGAFLVRVASCLDYQPVITWSTGDTPGFGWTSIFKNISMKETYYLRPRMSQEISCADCLT